jgi:hypothetical protein
MKTQGRFWMIVGPFTFFLVLGALFMALGKSYGMRELLSAFGLLEYYCVRTLRHDFVTHTKQCASTVRFTVLFLTVIFLTNVIIMCAQAYGFHGTFLTRRIMYARAMNNFVLFLFSLYFSDEGLHTASINRACILLRCK